MANVQEFNHIDALSPIRQQWGALLGQTAGASFFQSLDWLEVYWRHYGQGQKLRVLLVTDRDGPAGILPLVVREETTRVGRLRVLNYPLHDWGSFYGPIGSAPMATLAAGLEHLQNTDRDWDILELRWQGPVGADPARTSEVMRATGLHPYTTLWDRTAIVDVAGTWESYWSSRKGPWLRRFRAIEQKLLKRKQFVYEHYRPLGQANGDGSPRWDLYDTCEEIARQSWQGQATDGTTLSHESVRRFLRASHEVAAAAGAVDLHLLSIDGVPMAFLYNYHYRGYVSGLRRGYDARRSPKGAGHVLLVHALRDSFARSDQIYDLGVGSLSSKRHFQTELWPIVRISHFPLLPARIQLLRLKRWWQQRHDPASTALGRIQEGTAESR